jgi:quinol monooxygenase YgiN
MFVQLIQGRTSDAEGLRRQLEAWVDGPGRDADGYLGTTAGVSADGRFIAFARFADEAAARANSDRPEQGAWWAETEKYFDGEPTFRDTSDVETLEVGGRDDAGFVQVMTYRCTDRARLAELDEKFRDMMAEVRPDVIGSLRTWFGDECVEAIYFTSEAEARAGEQAMGDTGGAEFMALLSDLSFLDLPDPWLFSRSV